MTEPKMISRRDWFRLRTSPGPAVPDTQQPKELKEPTKQPERERLENVLRPVEHPPNHDGLDLSKLPPMREALLSRDEVDALFSDIENLASDILLMQRSAGAARANAPRTDSVRQLEMARNALLSGLRQRVQIRYQWNNSLWIDTLENQPGGFRIIRIAHAS